jgi:hypothetical protein
MMRARPLAVGLTFAAFALGADGARALRAQQTHDEARLVFSLGAGYSFGRSLWAVNGQPYFLGNAADTFNLTRRIRESFNVYFTATYYKNSMLGVNAEAAVVGIGTTTTCTDAAVSGSPNTTFVCNSLNGTERGGAAVLASVGPVLRFLPRAIISPFVQANAGLTIGTSSTVQTEVFVPDLNFGSEVVQIYDDPHGGRLAPGFTLGGGFTGQISPGWAFRLEARDNIVQVREVLGPTERDGLEPASRKVFKHIPSVSIGIGIILERKRGRRY